MIRDWLASGHWTHPVQFAQKYYLHYPKVAFGVWGPLLHILGGIWMLLFSPARASILLLMALITALIATILFRILEEHFSLELSLAGGLMLISIPVVQEYTSMVMADNLVALMDLVAAWWFARFLKTGRARHSILFGIAVTLSILTKTNGMALILLPPLAILFTRRWDLLKSKTFWYSAVIVLLIGGPWQYYTTVLNFRIYSAHRVGWDVVSFYTLSFLRMCGWWLLPLILLGVWTRLVRPFRDHAVSGVWASAGALIAALWVFHSMVPSASPEARYTIAAAPPLILFLAAGIHELAARLTFVRLALRWRTAVILLAACLVFAGATFAIPQKKHFGYIQVAREMDAADPAASVYLISSLNDGEGMFICEVEMLDHTRMRHYVLRASKVLAQSDWAGGRYRTLQNSPEQVLEYMESVPVTYVIVDRSPATPVLAHHRMLIEALTSFPNRAKLIASYSSRGYPIEVYKLLHTVKRLHPEIRIEMPYTFGGTIEEKR